MALDKAAVAHIARLARIRVTETELDHMAKELAQILAWVEQLQALDTEGVEPMASGAGAGSALRGRDDVVTDGGYADKILANAPAAAHGFFAVPKVVE